jgi:hypothetical protein
MSPERIEMEPVKFTSDDIGVLLLESITQGLYRNPLNSIREYAQNEFDAAADEIRITITSDKIIITGNGTGMSEEELLDARKLGYSSKDPTHYVGFRGIGIWSGAAICDEILISTKKENEKTGHVLSIDAKGLRADIKNTEGKISLAESLSNRVKIGQSSKIDFQYRYGTSVELRKLLPEHLEMLDKDTILAYICQILPVRIDPEYEFSELIETTLKERVPEYRTIRILVNDEEAYRPPFRSTQTINPIFSEIHSTDDEHAIAFSWYAISEKGMLDADARNPVYKKKGFTIDDMSRSNTQVLKEADKHSLTWSTGEIHVLDQRIIPTSERTDFEAGPTLREMESQVKKLLDTIGKEVRIQQAGATSIDRLKYADELMSSLHPTLDSDERAQYLDDGIALLRLMKEDIRNPKIVDKVKKSISSKIKKLEKALQTFSTADVLTTVNSAETAKKTRRGRKRKKISEAEKKSAEELVGELAARFDFDKHTIRLLAAVVRAFMRYCENNKSEFAKLIDLLKEELEE